MYLTVLLVTSMMLFLNHPLSFALSLFVQTILISLMLVKISYWIPLILFLIFLGGILVMFMYVASLSSNEKFNFNVSSLITVCIISFLGWLSSDKVIQLTSTFEFNPSENMSSIMNSNSWFLYIWLTLYLFIALILIVQFLNFNKKPLRSTI
uniref:NADH-ubiquinone oxidoreductase chain 6 n=1 Tax=Phallocryptus tserensodnomi TaxID=1383053 RepID=A0A0U1Z446_9CRUS|nr:NADH dehydrogenase subunit 6 [Phallocryptus tserensodnomi]AJP76849.1 NADH dehydrogenase subunit 6 [Phallocryptus tserensodnomi]